MGHFVDYLANPFADLSETPTTVLVTDAHPIQVLGFIVCNRGSEAINFTLKYLKDQTSPVETVLIPEFEIKPRTTVDVAAYFGLNITLEYKAAPDPSIVSSLICFTNGYTQKFDCTVSYEVLKDLPLLV